LQGEQLEQNVAFTSERVRAGKPRRLASELRINKQLYLLMIPGVVFFIVFGYLPLGALVIAFQDYSPVRGILGSEFVGLRNFAFLFRSPKTAQVVVNTLFLNTLFMTFGTLFALTIALLLSEMQSKAFVKTTQSIMILPHFISWAVVSLMLLPLISSQGGQLVRLFGAIGLDVDFNRDPWSWPPLLVVIRLWKGAGWSSIIYLAALTSIDPQIYEAAVIDGANVYQRIFRIKLPGILDMIILLLLFQVGRIFYGDFAMIWALVRDNSLLYPTTDIIDTFVFRALRQWGDLGMASAVGLVQSLLGFVVVMITNGIARRYRREAAIY